MIKKRILGTLTSLACAAGIFACFPATSASAVEPYGPATEDTSSGIIYRLVDEDLNGKYDAAEICGVIKNAERVTIPSQEDELPLMYYMPGCFNELDNSKLNTILVDPNNSYFSVEDNVLFNKGKTILYSCPIGLNKNEYDIPSTVESIESSAFQNCSKYTKINLMKAEKLTSIGSYAFANCKDLEIVTIPVSVNSIGVSAFENTKSYTEQSGPLYYIDKWLVKADTKITAVIEQSNAIKSGTLGIADSAFANCKELTQITIPDTISYIGNAAFNSCTKLTGIEGAEKLVTIGRYTFAGCTTITKFNMSDTVKSIGEGAFSACSGLNTVVISKNLTEIPAYAFKNCSKLLEVDLSEKVEKIGEEAFNGCNALKSITIRNAKCDIDNKASTIGGTKDTEICGIKDSTTETYTKTYNRLFKEITSTVTPPPEYPRGDANKDGVTNVRDAAHIARYAAQGKLNDLDVTVADYNSDNKVDVRDAAAIARDMAKSK